MSDYQITPEGTPPAAWCVEVGPVFEKPSHEWYAGGAVAGSVRISRLKRYSPEKVREELQGFVSFVKEQYNLANPEGVHLDWEDPFTMGSCWHINVPGSSIDNPNEDEFVSVVRRVCDELGETLHKQWKELHK
jgi:hypothetical protein